MFRDTNYSKLASEAEALAKRSQTSVLQRQWEILAEEYLKLAKLLAEPKAPKNH